MPKFTLPGHSWKLATLPDKRVKKVLAKQAFQTFNSGALGLGNLKAECRGIDSIATMFDLEGFTHFCRQIEPQLSVPTFLSAFLDWLMFRLRDTATKEEHDDGFEMWCPLPYFVKFMGDGLLVLWDSTNMNATARRNVITSCRQISIDYSLHFLPAIRKQVTDPPPRLRCGVARGMVFSVGNGDDYVGSCINMAMRLQKLSSLSFAFNRRGFDLDEPKMAKFFTEHILIKAISIRGISEQELVGVERSEFEYLPEAEQQLFRDP
jgi:class 3 adenylate cyclase